MKKREEAREMIKRSSGNQKVIWTEKYKKIRNRIKGTSFTQSNTFINDAARVWNNAPQAIKDCKSIDTAKKAIRQYIVTLPI